MIKLILLFITTGCWHCVDCGGSSGGDSHRYRVRSDRLESPMDREVGRGGIQ